MKLHLKSFGLGAALAATVFLAVAATQPSDHEGRYQVSVGSGLAIIIDTETGRAWGANTAIPAPNAPVFQGIQPGFWEKKRD